MLAKINFKRDHKEATLSRVGYNIAELNNNKMGNKWTDRN